MKNTLCYLLVIMLAYGPLHLSAQNVASSPVQLPVKMDLNRFLLKIPTNNGDTVLGYCDTGGGYTAVYPSTLSKLGMQDSVQQVVIDGDTTRFIPASRIYADNMIPYPEILRYFKGKIAQPFFEVPADDPQNDMVRKLAPHDAFLGQLFFIGHAWTFNYLKGQLFINTPEITGADMIEVPEVKVGNLRAGPVWFASRPDEAWSKGMVGSMDRIVKGAIGGSLLQYFKVTIDYNSERIHFEQ